MPLSRIPNRDLDLEEELGLLYEECEDDFGADADDYRVVMYPNEGRLVPTIFPIWGGDY